MTEERLISDEEEQRQEASLAYARALIRRNRFVEARFPGKKYRDLTREEKEKVDAAIKKANASLRSVH